MGKAQIKTNDGNTGMEYCIKKPVYNGKRIKEFGVIVRMPSEMCSDSERDYMRTRYIAKLLEWKHAEIENLKAKN